MIILLLFYCCHHSPIYLLRYAHFPTDFCCHNNMHSSFLTPLPAAHSERRFTLTGQLVQIRSEAQLEVLADETAKLGDTPLIQNYYCQHRSGELTKVTIIRIGREVLRLTDKITFTRQSAQEEDDKTKYSTTGSSQSEQYSQSYPKHRKPLSKSAKTLLSHFEEWVLANDPESLKMILPLRQEYSCEEDVVGCLANSVARELFLSFSEYFLQQGPQIRIAKLATVWMKRCLIAREHQRMKEEYIQEVLEKL